LRKDFMVDTWQVTEARAIGADAILIIVAALEDAEMAEIEAAAIDHGMDVLVEVHDEAEMERAARLRSRLIGVNNRDLRSFVTDLATTERLAPLAPEGALLVGESGIGCHADCLRLAQSGVRSFLVGESLMRQPDVAKATRTLLHG
jgi:indole-3-glycerol phosphate synthase